MQCTCKKKKNSKAERKKKKKPKTEKSCSDQIDLVWIRCEMCVVNGTFDATTTTAMRTAAASGIDSGSGSGSGNTVCTEITLAYHLLELFFRENLLQIHVPTISSMRAECAAHTNMKIHARPYHNATQNQLPDEKKKPSSIMLSFTHNTVLTYSSLSCVRDTLNRTYVCVCISIENSTRKKRIRVCACRALHIYSFWFFFLCSFSRSLVSSLRVPFVERTPAPTLSADRAKSVFHSVYGVLFCFVCVSACFSFSLLIFALDRLQCADGGACAVRVLVECLLRRCVSWCVAHRTYAHSHTLPSLCCAHTHTVRCRKSTLRLLYKGRQVRCRSHIRACLRLANNSLSSLKTKNTLIKINRFFFDFSVQNFFEPYVVRERKRKSKVIFVEL